MATVQERTISALKDAGEAFDIAITPLDRLGVATAIVGIPTLQVMDGTATAAFDVVDTIPNYQLIRVVAGTAGTTSVIRITYGVEDHTPDETTTVVFDLYVIARPTTTATLNAVVSEPSLNTGELPPGDANDSGAGWVDFGAVLVEGAGEAVIVVPPPDGEESKILASEFMNTVPAGATILGVVVKVKAFRVGTGADCQVGVVAVHYPAGPVGSEVQMTGNLTGTVATYILGGPNDLWGLDLADDFLEFFQVRLHVSGGVELDEFHIDHVTVTVYYRPAV